MLLSVVLTALQRGVAWTHHAEFWGHGHLRPDKLCAREEGEQSAMTLTPPASLTGTAPSWTWNGSLHAAAWPYLPIYVSEVKSFHRSELRSLLVSTERILHGGSHGNDYSFRACCQGEVELRIP